MAPIDESCLHKMRTTYRAVRKIVYEKATCPAGGHWSQHEENKRHLRDQIVRICADANLDTVSTPDEPSRLRLWRHLWTKNRYAGIRAATASKEIEDIASIFCDYRAFASPEWDLVSKGQEALLHQSGEMIRHFMKRTGPFGGKPTVGNVPKLGKIVSVARAFATYVDEHPYALPISFATGSNNPADVWSVHNHLMGLGYTADLTALHCMMDLGFEVIKPDIVISRLFFPRSKSGWSTALTRSVTKRLSRRIRPSWRPCFPRPIRFSSKRGRAS
jgi:hypothetical protein